MPGTLVERVTSALEQITETMKADGYDMHVAENGPQLELIVTAGPEACAECLVPKKVFLNIAGEALRESGIVLDQALQVTYPAGHHQS